MNKPKYYRALAALSILCVSMLISACAGVKNTEEAQSIRSNDVKPSEDENSPSDWPALLRRVPGVKISGNYPNLSILIRGSKSVSQTSEPLYVLDGVPLGRDFSSLATAADPLQVKKIRVLKGAEALKYGMRGNNGVIEVTLKE